MLGDISTVVSDLMVLARHIEELISGGELGPEAVDLERSFAIFAEQKRLYDQIRFIGTDGYEILRVNLHDGRGIAVPSAQLQDKSDRYYFTAASGLDAGWIYVSPLDLNMEHGRIERPLKAVMRFATPVTDRTGRRRGILVLNYLGQRLLDELDRTRSAIADHASLLDPRGYWLRSVNPNDEWGFMLEHGRSFAERFPNAWQQIADAEQGQFADANGLFTFTTIYPRLSAAEFVNKRAVHLAGARGEPGRDYAWKLVSHLLPSRLAPTPGCFLVDNVLLYGALLGLLGLGSSLLAKARVHHYQAELQSEHERCFRRTLEDIQLAAVSLDRAGRITFCNRFFLNLTGRSREETVGSAWLTRFTPSEERPAMLRVLGALDRPGEFPASYSCQVLTHTDERRLLSWHNSLNRDLNGRVAGVTAIGEDITEKRRNETSLRKLSQAVEQSPSIVLITDRDGRIEYVNPKFTEVTGYGFDEVAGENPRVLKSGETEAEDYADLWRTICAGGEWRGELHNRRKNGELYWEAASISALRDAAGQITHFLAVKEDITERKRLERQIAGTNRELARAQALAEVGRMATIIAHDLRNPLSSVKVAFQVLGKSATDDGPARELRAIAREQIVYMEAILSDMLSYARPRQPTFEWLDAERLLQTVVALLQRRLDEAAVQAEIQVQPGLPTFPDDTNQLRQVFSSLITNAVQAMEEIPQQERSLHLGASLHLDETGTRIRFDVRDSGTGLAGQDPEHLLEPFVTSRTKGTGLGLAIVRKIIDAHHGRILLQPNPPRGTCATLLLPTVPDLSSGQV